MTRSPAVAGQFYPADSAALAAEVDAMLAGAPAADPGGRVVAIQVPHAGYPYSGRVAARAFKLVAGSGPVTVVMVGTSHRVMLTGAAVFPKGAWRTPLGAVPVDEELARDVLARDSTFQSLPEAHRMEHSLEVQVPFLQRALGSFRVVPIMVLQPSWDQCERMGRALAAACRGRNVLLLASTDLYHGESYSEAVRTDSLTVAHFAGFNPRDLHAALDARKAQACGGYAVVVTMVAARELGADRAVVLETTNSNDVTGERGGYCVGYSATAFVAGGPAGQAEPAADPDALDAAERSTVLALARRTVEQYVRSGVRPGLPRAEGRLAEPRGVFVTLHRQGDLRGCIGYVEPVKPLVEAVREMAVSAATEDPRFLPVRPEELALIDIEVTVLSPLRRVADPESVEVGRHGLIIRRGGRSGLLLPQVPVEQGWDRRTFLEHTCLKAGLPTNAWQDPKSELWVFTGQVFGEKDAH
ncbi:MAG: AmmeMemoRadiSam system protein B [bacterium]